MGETAVRLGTAANLPGRLFGLTVRRPSFALTLCGEAGIGKSFTARALLAGCTCATFSTPATRPLASLLLALPRPRKCPAPLERLLERLAEGEALAPDVVQDALSALLGALAPFVLYAEDLHEAVPETLLGLTRLAERVSGLRGVGLLSSSRTPPPPPFEVVMLERLSAAHSRELLETEVHTPLPPEACEWVYTRAAGNPLYTLEFFRALARAGHAWSDGQRWHWRAPPESLVPASVEALIERALLGAADSEKTRWALETLALLADTEPSEPLLCQVAGLEQAEFAGAAAQLRARGVLTESGFAHPLYRELTLKNLSAAQRIERSRRAVAALEDCDIEAAAGFVPDAALDSGRALDLLKRAATRARERGDLGRAGRFLALAVPLAAGAEHGELALEGAHMLRSAQMDKALELVEIAAQTLIDPLEATLLWADLLAYLGRSSDAEALFAQIAEGQRSGPQGLSRRLILLAAAGRLTETVALWEAHPELHALEDGELFSQAAFALSSVGQQERADALIEQALSWDSLSLASRCQLLSGRGGVLFRRGEYEVAEQYYTEALGIARDQGIVRAVPSISFNRGYLRCNMGRYDEAMVDLEHASACWSELGNMRWHAHAQVNLAQVETQRQRFEAAEQRLLGSLEVLTTLDPNDSLYDCLNALCTLYEEWETPYSLVLLEKYARQCGAVADALNSPRNRSSARRWLGVVELGNGRLEQALELFGQALEISETVGIPSMVARCHFSRRGYHKRWQYR